ncbi:hypothetical protein [Chlorobium sp. N1]|uniref:hypothetical protein n=1 Tax=Chlorobium sp. N1 TaxID=2491138 RepID=UPI00103F6AA8|nr:hypothetical protein [Chlorobium sp. N1]TCD48236.1 hypothetical protein E0L29_04980 [Chlorobium sp. N1]
MTNNWKEAPSINRSAVLERWMAAGLGLFPERMTPGSPAGEALADAMATLVDHFAEDGEERREGLERLTRIFAVQSMPPSKSLSLFGTLGDILAGFVAGSGEREAMRRHLERLTLEAFDCFMENRERIYRLKVEESRSQMHMLLRRAVS